MRRAVLIAAFFVALSASAQTLIIKRCMPGDGQQCEPPATWQQTASLAPLAVPVRFGGLVPMSGDTYWLWIKAADMPRPCSAQELASHARECAVRVGEPLYITPRFRMAVQR